MTLVSKIREKYINIKDKLALTFMLLLIALTAWLFIDALRLRHSRDLALRDLAAAQSQITVLNWETESNRSALMAREAEAARLASENKALKAAIYGVYQNDPEAKNWADTLCPDSIHCLLD